MAKTTAPSWSMWLLKITTTTRICICISKFKELFTNLGHLKEIYAFVKRFVELDSSHMQWYISWNIYFTCLRYLQFFVISCTWKISKKFEIFAWNISSVWNISSKISHVRVPLGASHMENFWGSEIFHRINSKWGNISNMQPS